MRSLFIITFHYSKNYGAFLQSFSLNKQISNSTIVNFTPGYHLFAGRLKKILPFFWVIVASIKYYKYLFIKKKIYPKFDKNGGINKTKHFTNPLYKTDLFNEGIAICGSDQIWNPKFMSKYIPIYFASFSNFSKRISYAASLGMKEWPKDFEQQVLPLLQRFDAISVREESSVPYLTSLGLKNVVCVCDPTILHNGDFYKEQFPANKVYKEDYAFVYKIRVDIPESVQSIFPKKVLTVDLKKHKTLISVTDWLSNIDNAKFIITDSFHCAVFCLLFHKPFLVIPNQSTGKGMNERFGTLLGKTNLEYRCLNCDETTEQVLEKLKSPIDWDHVDAILEVWRTYSSNWLKNALEACINNQ